MFWRIVCFYLYIPLKVEIMKFLFIVFLTITSISAQNIMVDSPDFEKDILIDTIDGKMIFKTNFVAYDGYRNGELVEVGGNLANSKIEISTNLTTLSVDEDGNKFNCFIKLDSIQTEDYSYVSNDTNFSMIIYIYYFTTEEKNKILFTIYNNRYPGGITIRNDIYTLNYYWVKEEHLDNVLWAIEHNKRILEERKN
jgi:hypothetical protein